MDDRRPDLAKRFALAAHSNAVLPILLVLEILETTIVPFPYEAIFVALCLAAPQRTWLFVAVTVAGSAIAGSILYSLGAGFAEPLARYLNVQEAVEAYKSTFSERGGALIFLGGLTPVPSYFVNLVAGATGYPFATFLALFSSSRFIRFALLGLLIHLFGEAILAQWSRLPIVVQRTILILFLAAVTWWLIANLG